MLTLFCELRCLLLLFLPSCSLQYGEASWLAAGAPEGDSWLAEARSRPLSPLPQQQQPEAAADGAERSTLDPSPFFRDA